MTKAETEAERAEFMDNFLAGKPVPRPFPGRLRYGTPAPGFPDPPWTDDDREVIMDHVKSCPYHTCGYQTNVKGDMAKHLKDKHAKRA